MLTNNKVHDFDMFWKETAKEPIKFKLLGKEEELPPSLPAILMLKLLRAQKKYGENSLPEHVQMDIAFSIFGEDRTEKWANEGLSIDQLGDLIKWAMKQYNPEVEAKNVMTSNET